MEYLKTSVKFLPCIVLLWLAGFAMFCGYSLDMKPAKDVQSYDAIIVLTGGANQRIDKGLELFATGRASHLFISGVHPDVTRAEILKRWDGATALPPCCMDIGQQATTTAENAMETKEWAKDRDISSVLLVTSNYHMVRALQEFRDALPAADLYPYPVAQSDLTPKEQRIWMLLFSEYHKMILRWVQLIL